MKILIIADPIITVPPINYGGTERIIDLYAKEFRRLGHIVNIMASKGSNNYDGTLYTHKAPSKKWISRAYRKIIFQFQSVYAVRNCDFIFNHGRFDYLESLLKLGKPIIQYQHNGLDTKQIKMMESKANKRFKLICVSKDQLSDFKTNFKTKVINNFVDTNFYPYSEKGEGYLAFLGRLTKNKGVDFAIKIAKSSKKKLKIAGTIPDIKEEREFFENEVNPNIDNNLIEFVGKVNDTEKKKFLGQADALLCPGLWKEPCAVTVSESFSCGTPVISYDVSSFPELINHGVNGYLISKEEGIKGMVKYVKQIHKLSRSACRETAEKRFDVRIAARNLLESIP